MGAKNLFKNSSKRGIEISKSHPIKKKFFVTVRFSFLNLSIRLRHLIKFKGRVFEVDEFKGVNMGLVLAEIELNSENELFEKPEWLGAEVTGNAQYYNAYLSQNPYSNWRN